MADAATSLLSELDEVVQHGAPARCAEMLRQITTLFLAGASRFNDEHVDLFDSLFARLIEEIEAKARAELSRQLAPVPNAPRDTVRRLAKDDDIQVAGPVLAQSPRLADEDLVDIARSKSQAHLFAISSRQGIDESITDVLLQRGEREVVRKVVGNPGARLSQAGYGDVVRRAEKDGMLAETVAQRTDIPDPLFRELLTRATEVVQRRLLANAAPERRADIIRILTEVSDKLRAANRPPLDYTEAQKKIAALAAAGELDERKLAEFAKAAQYEETVVALAELSLVPLEVVDRLLAGERTDPILILCKAAGFSWETARLIILARPGNLGKSLITLDAGLANFDKLSPSTAQRVVRFWQAA
jgi:uncharacterized protein (DUF2336 family)